MIDILTQTMTLVEFGLQVISLSVLQYKITSIPSLLHPEEKSSLQLGAAGGSHGTRSVRDSEIIAYGLVQMEMVYHALSVFYQNCAKLVLLR